MITKKHGFAPSVSFIKMRWHGFILPFSVLAATILLTSAGFWYKQSFVQSRLENLMIEKHILYIECNSLIPILLKKLRKLPAAKLLEDENNFLIVQVGFIPRWSIDRLSLQNNNVPFIFHQSGKNTSPIKITTPFKSD
ncbi:MAG: hypothetical protein GY786_20260 [Proteobacteria bacterium]|nr:hypothetical protein [Pseudomonadota bacterium]